MMQYYKEKLGHQPDLSCRVMGGSLDYENAEGQGDSKSSLLPLSLRNYFKEKQKVESPKASFREEVNVFLEQYGGQFMPDFGDKRKMHFGPQSEEKTNISTLLYDCVRKNSMNQRFSYIQRILKIKKYIY